MADKTLLERYCDKFHLEYEPMKKWCDFDDETLKRWFDFYEMYLD